MSLNIVPLQPVEINYPPTQINSKRVYGVLKGTRDFSVQPFVSTSFSSSQIQWTANPPSRDHIVDRKAYVQVTYTFTVTGTTDGTPGVNVVQLGLEDAPRCFPFHTTCKSFQATINNDNVSIVPDQYIQAFLRYHNPRRQRAGDYSETPSFLDQYQSYNDYKTYGSALNPLGNYGENGQEPLRGGYVGVNLTGNSATTCTVTLTVTEPLFVSPFIFARDDYESGLVGIQNMMFVATLGDLSRIWSHNPTAQHINTWAMGAVTVSSPTLYFTFRTVPFTEHIPRAISYSYFEVVPYPTTSTTPLASLGQVTLNMSSVQLKTIPRRMYIYARKQDADLKNTDPDTFAVIGNFIPGSANPQLKPLSITFNNRTGLLSTLSTNDLFEMGQKNGLETSYSAWGKHQGSVLCLEFGSDIGLAEDEAPGIIGNYQISLSLTITNPSANAITYTLYVVVVNEGTFSVVDGSCQHMIGVISKSDVLNARPMQGVSWKRAQHVYGGNFFSDLVDTVSDVGRTVYDVGRNVYSGAKKYVSPILNVAQKFIPKEYQAPLHVARNLTGIGGARCANGRRKRCILKSRLKGRMRGKGVLEEYGSGLVEQNYGSGVVSRDELAQKLMGGNIETNESENESESDSNEKEEDDIEEYGN